MFFMLHRDLEKEFLIQGSLNLIELLLILWIFVCRPIEESVYYGHLSLEESGESVEEGLKEVGSIQKLRTLLLLGKQVLSLIHQDIKLVNECTLYKSVNEHGFLPQVRIDQQY